MYEIPQELQYKEKIVFGLTFKQLAWAILFLPIVLIILTKTSLKLETKLSLSLIPTILASLFVFFDFSKKLKNFYLWLKFRNITTMSLKMKRFLGIKNIKNDIIEIKHYKRKFPFKNFYTTQKLAILEATPINFAIKTEKEKEAIIKGFEKFLNSLDFPVQILITTTPLDINTYLDKIKSNKFQKHYQDYKDFLNKIITENKIVNRNFYLIIKETSNISIQISICKEKLESINIKSRQLQTKELKQFLINQFSKDITDKADKEVNKENYLHYLISPKMIENHPDLIKINNNFNRIITAHGYPRLVEPGFLDKIITGKGNFDLSVHIEPIPIETTMIILDKELQKQRADLYSAKIKSSINPSLEIKYQDTRKVLEELQKGIQKLYNVSLYINCKAENKSDLDLLTKKIESDLNSLMIIPKIPYFEMLQGLKSTSPLAIDELKVKRNITTQSLSAFFAFTSQFLNIDEKGVFFGLNKNSVPIIKDIYSLTNANGLILATSGSGKSFFSKLFISRHLLNDVKVMVIDPQSEYTQITKKFGGQVVDLSRTSSTIINPLDLMQHDYAEKRLSLMDLLPIMLGELSEIQKATMDRVLTFCYEKKGITNDEKTWLNKPPILSDLLVELERMEKKATIIEKPTYRSLINRLSMYTSGVFSFLNKHTKIDFENDFVCFNLGEMPKQVKPVVMFLILDYVYMKMRETKQKKILVIDEAWSLLNRVEEASYIFEIVKTARKFNLGLLLITQDVADLLKSDAGNALLANSSYSVLLRQKPAVIDDISKTFRLSKVERDTLLTANIGEGILILENEHTELKVIASEDEYKIITTNPNDLVAKKTKVAQKQKEVSIDVDVQKCFYEKSSLKEHEIEYLVNKGYLISSHVDLHGGHQRDYLLLPKANESLSHFFLVMTIRNYLMNFTNRVFLYNTLKPDIVFEAFGKKVAVEVETGLHNNKKDLEEKVYNLRKEYKDNWFFVISHKHLREKYEKYGKVYVRTQIPSIIDSYFRGAPSVNTNSAFRGTPKLVNIKTGGNKKWKKNKQRKQKR